MKIEKRIERLKNRTLKSFSPWLAYPHNVFHPIAVFTNFRTFAVIFREFFLIQFLEKFGILKIPVVHVDHPLDEKIPFIPQKIGVYLDFINLWVRPLEMMSERLGFVRSGKECKRWMRMFRGLYNFSAQIYHFRLTTTNRPDYEEMREFRQIHAIDPHYLCVPSLHISTLALAYGFYRRVFVEEHFTEDEISRWQPELYEGAVEIAETVLYVKQHSVNCVPAALYLVAANFADYFSADDARKFLDDMFKNPDGFSAETAEEVKNYMRDSFEGYLKKGAELPKERWYEPVREFLVEYEKGGKTEHIG